MSFRVGQSLAEALEHLQDPKSTLTLWIDAICINQTDDEEKSRQVNQMGAIFERAAMVMAWLGPSMDDSQHALRMLFKLALTFLCELVPGCDPARDSESPRRLIGNIIEKMASHITLGDHMGADIPITPIRHLFQRPWGHRLWILQETALAKRILFVCGHDRIPSFYLQQAYLALASLSRQPPARLSMSTEAAIKFKAVLPTAPSIMLNQCQGGCQDRSRPLAELLSGNFELLASNPRDYIFGMLSLASDAGSLGIQADYTKSVESVFIDTATALLRSGELCVLSLVRHPRRLDNMPTWVPDLTNLRLGQSNATFQSPHSCITKRFSAGIGSVPMKTTTKKDGTVQVLSVAGVAVDLITDVKSWLPYNIVVQYSAVLTGISSFLEDFEAFVRLKQMAYGFKDELSDMIWRVPIGNLEYRTLFENPNSAGTPSTALYESYQVVRGFKTAPLEETNPEDWWVRNATPYIRTVMERVWGKKFFISSKGYLGYGNSNLQQGDQIVLFHGAEVPHIIRSAENGRYSFVSDAYVHGIMYGEFLGEQHESKMFELV